MASNPTETQCPNCHTGLNVGPRQPGEPIVCAACQAHFTLNEYRQPMLLGGPTAQTPPPAGVPQPWGTPAPGMPAPPPPAPDTDATSRIFWTAWCAFAAFVGVGAGFAMLIEPRSQPYSLGSFFIACTLFLVAIVAALRDGHRP